MYKDDISDLIRELPLEVDLDIQMRTNPPTAASSEFLINKEQGDWAEQVVHSAINEYSDSHFSVQYGRSDSISAGDPDFAEFYKGYQDELNTIGKKPDLLIFGINDFPNRRVDIENDDHISKAVAAIEVRSSSFLYNKYTSHMEAKQSHAIENCVNIKNDILSSELGSLLESKNETIYRMLSGADSTTFRELDFRRPSWSLTPELRALTEKLKDLKESIKVLHKRNYLSITPKMEDIALANRWIQKYNVKHFYLQVFFDKAYVISFREILEHISDEENDGASFSIERDIKNQGKTTIKINVQIGKEILGKIDMPQHASDMKELDRGRLIFYVTFEGGKGYLNNEVFTRDIINA